MSSHRIIDFVEFISRQAGAWADPVYGEDLSKTRNKQAASCHTLSDIPKQYTQRARPNNQGTIKPCVLCNQMHCLFKGMTPAARLELVKDKKLCFNCLLPFHTARTCYKQSVCSVPGCGKKHTKFVYVDTHIDDIPVDSVADRGSPVPDNVVNTSNTNASGTNVYLPIVQMLVNGKRINALLDKGSTNTFITESLASSLNLKGNDFKYVLNTVSHARNASSK